MFQRNETRAEAVEEAPEPMITSTTVIILAVVGFLFITVIIVIIAYRKWCRPVVVLKGPNIFSTIYPHIPQSVMNEVVDIPRDDIWEFSREK